MLPVVLIKFIWMDNVSAIVDLLQINTESVLFVEKCPTLSSIRENVRLARDIKSITVTDVFVLLEVRVWVLNVFKNAKMTN